MATLTASRRAPLSLVLAARGDGHRPDPSRRLGKRPCQIVGAENDLRVPPADDGFELGGAFDTTVGPADEIKRAEHDVLGSHGDGRRVGQHASELSLGVMGENPRLGSGVIDEEHAPFREKTAKMRDLGIGEREEWSVADEVSERFGEQRVIVGANGRRRQARGGARAVDEFARPARRGGSANPFEIRTSRQEWSRIEGAVFAKGARLTRREKTKPQAQQRCLLQKLVTRRSSQSKSSTFQTPPSRRSLTKCPP